MSKCVFHKNDLNSDLQDRLQDALEEIWEEQDEMSRKTMFINNLKEVGEGYDITSLPALADFIDDFVMEIAPELHDIVPSNMTTYLSGNSSNLDTITEENPTKLDSLDDPEGDAEAKQRVRGFIVKNYGTATEVSAAMEAGVVENMVKCFFVNRDTGKVIKTTHEMNEELRSYQESLLQDVVAYLKDVYSKLPEGRKDAQDALKELSELSMWKDGKYLNAVGRLNSLGEKYLHHSHFTADDLRKAYSRNRTVDKKFIKAYNSLVILNHFDDLLSSKLKGILKINENIPKYSPEDRYSISGFGAHNNRDWGDKEKDVNMNEQTSDLGRLLVETTPIYTWGNSTPIGDKKVKLDAFNYIISKIKSLTNSPDVHNTALVFDDIFFIKYPQFEHLRRTLEGKTFYTLLSTLKDKRPLENLNALFELMSDNNFFNDNHTLFRGFKSIEKNLIYSLRQGIFGDNPHSLFGIYKSNILNHNYYGDICQLVSTASPLDFIQYRVNEDGEVVRATLRGNLNSQLRRQLEERISASLSVIAPTVYDLKTSKYNPRYEEDKIVGRNGDIKSVFVFRFRIPELNLDIQFNPKAKKSNAFSVSRDGKPISTFNGKEDFDKALGFIKDFLREDFTPDSPLVENYLALKTQNNNIQYDAALTDLLQLSTSVFFNSYFSHKLVPKNVNLQEFRRRQEEVFGMDNLTSINRRSPEIGLILPDYIPIMDDITSAYGMTTDAYTSGIVRDGSGNSLSGVAMSMLGTSYRSQWVQQCLNANSATNMFSLLNNPSLHRGMAVSREYRGGNESKKHIDFNMPEAFYTAFVNNYLCNIAGDTDAAFLPSVISDKSQLIHELISLNQVSQLGGVYSKLSRDEVITIINKELGDCYSKVMDNIINEWNTLNTTLASSDISFALNDAVHYPLLASKKILPVFNPLTNFAEVNAVYGNDSRKVLEEVLKVYQSIAGDSLEIKDELSFQGGKTLSFNRTLISLTNRFNPSYFTSRGLNPETVFGKLTNSEDFWKIKETEMLTDLLDNDFTIETTDERGEPITTREIAYLAKNTTWVKPSTKRVILAKYKNFGKTFDITKWSDLSSIGGYTENGITYNFGSPGFSLSKFLELRGGTLEIHPDLARFNVLDYLFSQEYVLSTVGLHANHPAKKATSNPNDLVEEAARYIAQHKRNVSYTAAKQVMIQGLIDGILPEYRIAVIEDDASPTYNAMGDYDEKGVKQYDGSTFVSPETMYLENNSLGGARVGVDKKPFIHFYKEGTASGGIIKTAGFALTNFTMSNSEFYQRMVRKMWSTPWTSQYGLPFTDNVLVDFMGNQIAYEDVYYKGTDGKFYMINSITYNGDGTYSLIKSEVEPDGTIVRQLPIEITPKPGEGPMQTASGTTLYPVNTNFGLYQMFGGWHSYSKVQVDENNFELQPSEVSVRNVVAAVNGVGTKLSENVLSQEDVYQPLKRASIQYVVTAGAIKQGAANVNLKHAYFDDEPYLTMTFKTNDIGIQLDAEHSADESTLSIMTQVVNALSSRGYTTDQAGEVYEAMFALTEAGINDYIEGFRKYIGTGDASKFKNAIVSTIVKSIQNSTSRDGNLMQAIMDDLITATKTGKLLTYENTEGIVPYSDPSMFNSLCSAMSSTLTKVAVRLKFNGNLAVLNPSHKIWKLYGDRMYDSFNNSEEIQNLQKLYDSKPITNISEIRLGRYYNVTVDGATTPRFIETPLQYWALKDELAGKEYSIVENITAGRDLASYNFTFKDMDGNLYNMWDLDVIRDLYTNVQDKKALRRRLQDSLAAVSTGKLNTVIVNGRAVQVNKSSLDAQPYELIMPKIYASRFGLKRGDSLSTIKNDDTFFLKRMLANWESKVSDSDFDIELKRLDGKHVYLVDKRFYKDTNLTPVEIETRWDGNKLYRVNHSGDKLYRLSDESDMVFSDANGNEIIVTNNTQFYIDSFNYHTIRVSDSAAKSEKVREIIQPILSSNAKVAKRFSKYLGKNDPTDIITYTNKLYEESIEKLRLNPRAKIDDPNIDAIRDSASEIYTSFIKSLDVLAARIPAQSMQSFMPMRVVGFDETDTNSAYVNYFQFWLQGSDLDIDKVSLLGYSFDKTGKYVGWSPYFNLHSSDTLKESENLPFPTNKELELVETDDKSLTNWGSSFVGSQKLFNFNGSEVIFLPDYDLDNSLGSLQALSSFLRMVKANDGKLYIPKGSKLPFNKIKEIVDRHNLYVRNSHDPENMIKNFISSYMFKISNNPINLMQSMSSIDDSVAELKDIANHSTEGMRNLQFTPGNVVNKYESMYDFQSGKKNVGIVASAIKVYDGLTQYYNTVLRSRDNIKQTELLFNRNICGKKFQLLANAYTDTPESIANPEVLNALGNVDNDTDAKLVFSALMTAATDNAKDPILAKINAGPNMMGLYTYGTAIGIPLRDLAGAMMSPTARILSRLMDSNVFNGKAGMSITAAIKYIEEGPSIAGLDTEFVTALKEEFGVGADASEFVIGKILLYRLSDIAKGHDLINNLRKKVRNIDPRVNKTPLYKFLEELSDYIRFVSVVHNDVITNSDGVQYRAIDSIKQLVQGASEMGRLRGIYALNQGLPNKVEDKFKFIDKFESIFEDRIREITSEEMETTVTMNGMVMKLSDVVNKLKNVINNESNPYRISFRRFMSDEEYRNTLISLYGGLKHSFNVLDAAWSVPHYRGYLESFHMDMEGNYMIMSKYRMMKDLGPRIIKSGGYFNATKRANVYKRLQSFCDMTLRNTWMKTSAKTITIPAGVTIMNNIGNRFVTQGDTPILLGTRWGNESFKMWMDSVVIPELKMSEANEFIQSLSPIRLSRTLTGNAAFVYSLPTNMLPRSTSEREILNRYKRAFNQLQSAPTYHGYPLTDLFFYYNLINFNGATTQNSLSTIFEDIVRTKSSPLIEEFHKFTSLLDSNSRLIEGVDYLFDEAAKWCAPTEDTNFSKGYYVRDYNIDDMRYHLFIRKSAVNGLEEEEMYNQEMENSFSDMPDETNEGGGGRRFGPNLVDYNIAPESNDYTNPWDTADINNEFKYRIDSNTVVNLNADKKLESIVYKGNTYNRDRLVELVKSLGGSESDLDIPYVTRVVDGISVVTVDGTLFSSIVTQLLDNPC